MYSITLRRVIALSFDEILRTDLWTSLLTKSNLIRPSAPEQSINSVESNRTRLTYVTIAFHQFCNL